MRGSQFPFTPRRVSGKLRALNISGQKLRINPRLALVLLAGLLLAFAFPRRSIAGFAWVAPAVILFVTLGQTGRTAFRLGFLGGLAFHLAALYWLWFIPVKFLPLLGWLVLGAYLSLYIGLWTWLCNHLLARFGIHGAGTNPRPYELAQSFAKAGWGARFAWVFTGTVLWVGLETWRGWFLSGFPWLAIGVSQYRVLPLIQFASFTGVSGISFVVVWASLSLGCAVMIVMAKPQRYWNWMTEVVVPGAVIGLLCLWGMGRVLRKTTSERELKLALIQPAIPQTMIWDANANTNRFRSLMRLSEMALASRPDVLVWPEAAMPGLLRYEEHLSTGVSRLARKHGVWIILGADDAEPRQDNPEQPRYFNSSFLVDPEGRLMAKYDKRRLVMFGEYVPWTRWLPFLKYFTPIEGGFTPGEKPVPFELKSPRARTSVLICFEDVFAQTTREAVEPDTDFLVNLTNDGWFGRSAAQWQHAANAVFRAIENGVPLVRCTNNGLTCWIDPQGRIHGMKFGDDAEVYGAGFRVVQLPLPPLGQKRQPTYYQTHGDSFGWGCVVVLVMTLAMPLNQRLRRNK